MLLHVNSGIQEKLGIMNGGVVYAVFEYDAQNSDELSFKEGERLVILRKGDEYEREWWWAQLAEKEGYVPRNLLGVRQLILCIYCFATSFCHPIPFSKKRTSNLYCHFLLQLYPRVMPQKRSDS